MLKQRPTLVIAPTASASSALQANRMPRQLCLTQRAFIVISVERASDGQYRSKSLGKKFASVDLGDERASICLVVERASACWPRGGSIALCGLLFQALLCWHEYSERASVILSGSVGLGSKRTAFDLGVERAPINLGVERTYTCRLRCSNYLSWPLGFKP